MANIHIEGSSKMDRAGFLSALFSCEKTKDYVIVRAHRSDCSLLHEWALHKLLYQLGMWKSHTESVDLNWPQKWYVRIVYFIFGGIALIFY